MPDIEKLSTKTLTQLSSDVDIHHDNKTTESRIVHVGIGAFHRAHQAVFTDISNEKTGASWGITGISMRSSAVRNLLQKQDFLYTVMEKSVDEQSLRVVRCVDDVIVAKESLNEALASIADSNTKIISVTVTEKGYCHANSHLDLNHEAIKKDLNDGGCGSLPGFLVKALEERKRSNGGKITLMSCDNLPHNGQILKAVVTEFVEKCNHELAVWVAENVAFCSTMVDRIVPAATSESMEYISNAIGLQDDAALLCEPFKQWVIEDSFNVDRPEWEAAGALIVKDVDSYEKLKLRFLNGCHSFTAYSGLLLGDEYIHETVVRPSIRQFIKSLSLQEMQSSLDMPAAINAQEYQAVIASRFANSYVPYKDLQVATDGSLKVPQRYFMPAFDLINKGIEPSHLSFAIAVWVHYVIKVYTDKSLYFSDPLSSKLGGALEARNLTCENKLDIILASLELKKASASAMSILKDMIRKHLITLENGSFEERLEAFLSSTETSAIAG